MKCLWTWIWGVTGGVMRQATMGVRMTAGNMMRQAVTGGRARVAAAAVCAAFVTALASCGRLDGEKNISGPVTGQETEMHEALTICSFNHLIKEEFITAFHESYPEVNLEIQSYGGMNGSGYAMYTLANGDIPDIYVTTQNFNREAQKEYLLDLSNYTFVNRYSNTMLDALNVDGGIYLLPSGYTLTGIYYNKTILEENGWEVPKSFQELTALSKQIEAAGYQTMGHGMVLDGFPFNYFFNIGNTMYFGTPEGTQWKKEFPKGEAKAKGNSELRATAEYFNKWVEQGFITTKHMETDSFMEGESVFFLCLGLNNYEHVTKDGKIYEFGIMPWLSEDGRNNMLTRNVTRYIGLNRSLAEKGSEQKLKDALKFMDYISTAEGQKALMAGTSEYMLPLNDAGAGLPDNSPYEEIMAVVNAGRTVPLLYVGWEDLVVPIAVDIKQLLRGEIDVDGLIEAFDHTNDAIQQGASDNVYAMAAERLTMEETARLVAVAEGIAVEADCAMISLNKYHGNDKRNDQGLGWLLYEGEISSEVVNMIRPRSRTISVLEMTGADIKAMQKAGFDLDGNGNPYEYLLFTRGDMELEDGMVYRLAIATGEMEEELRQKAVEMEISPNDAIIAYLKRTGIITADGIKFE